MPQALPGVSASSPPAQSRAGGFLRVVSPGDLDEQDRQRAATMAEASSPPQTTSTDLGAYIRQRWMAFRNHRNQGNNQINDRLLRAQRVFEGKYDPSQLVEIKKFGGSEVYSRLIAVKVRGASALLRDVYLGPDRPWTINPQPDPPVPPEIQAHIATVVSAEVQSQQQAGQPLVQEQVHQRYTDLMHAAQQAALRNAMTQADAASDKIDDILKSGNFYNAMAEFLVDLPLFPYAVMKGPVVRMVPKMTWVGTSPVIRNKPQMFWERVNPFNFYWTPGASKIEEAEVIERKRMTRADLNDLIGLPGYNEIAVRAALQDYSNGLRDWLDWPDTEEAFNEARENPSLNLSHMIDALEYHGNVQGHMLLTQGVDPRLIPDLDRDYMVTSWVVGRHTIKTQLNPSPRQRLPYFITSFEKVPGTVIGHGLTDILEDIQEMANATLRALVNNMAIASGPQVVINTQCLTPVNNDNELYPWKRWSVDYDPQGAANKPVDFFQPQSNANELLQVYQAMNTMADDISAIPRYLTGEGVSGGAGRTSSGLSMLMGNAQKVLQTVAANVDDDVLTPLLSSLYDMIMLTDTSGMLSGGEQVEVNGVHVAMQKETERQKQLQFLQITANPMDQAIVGQLGRGRLLRSIAQNMGVPDDIVPDDDTLQAQVAEQKKMQALQQMQLQWLAAHGIIPGKAGDNTQQMLLSEPWPSSPLQGGQGGQQGAAPGGTSPGGSPAAPAAPAAQAQGNQAKTPTPNRLSNHAPPFNAFMQGPKQGVPINVR